ncbi:MAG TPA: AAA family ATPase [Lachnospiraceae bacterium]|nr:AAA family ATPase [Lachnospiraceae bacterium]
MRLRIEELVLYRDVEGGVLDTLVRLQRGEAGAADGTVMLSAGRVPAYCRMMQEMFDIAENYGFSGNVWHSWLTWFLVYHENAYSKAAEIREHVAGGINLVALHDFEIFRQLFAYDFSDLEQELSVSLYRMAADYEFGGDDRRLAGRRIRDRIEDLSRKLSGSRDAVEFKQYVDDFYRDFGCGKFGLHKAFRIIHDGAGMMQIVPITNIAHVRLDDLIGCEIQKKKLRENTEAFLAGRRANNCLLFGDAGTGKSSSIKGILNEYYEQGLRIIEVYKHQFKELVNVLAQIKNRNYRFIIYMDDLSFEDFETDYKYLKAVIEGGLEKKPENVLIYATSNRRHLIRENYEDKEGEIRSDMHTSDTVQEKLSLSYRFGVTIYFGAPDRKEFNRILKGICDREGLNVEEEKLYREANAWELSHGGRSGRSAKQFIDHLLGTMEE